MKKIIEWWDNKDEFDKVSIKIFTALVIIVIIVLFLVSNATKNYEWEGIKPIIMTIWNGTK